MSRVSTSSPDPTSRKKTFLSNVRHELRTPLNAIIGYSEMLLEDAADAAAEVLEPLRQIRTHGTTLLNLVNTLLDAANVADGAIEASAVNVCLQMSQPLADVRARTQALMTCADTLGIAGFLDDLRKIEEAGRRLHKELADLQARCDLAGEEQGASGEENPASSLTPRPAPLALAPHPPSLATRHSPLATPGGRLLVVDDNDMNRDVLSRRLRSQGHQVTLACSGSEALALARAQPFDLILLDILMPGMNGLQVLQHLKEDLELRHVPVVMISALDEMDNIIRSIEMGAEDYLPKPFEPALLKARVGACLEKKRLRDREVEYLRQIEAERNRADGLLHVILPATIVQELKATNAVKPRRYENVAIMFSDIVGFTPYCDKRQPEEIVANLQELVVAFEEFAIAHDLQKIKTIGDSFMAACGLLHPVANPVLECVRCGIKMIEQARKLTAQWEVRIGIHCGSVVAGVLGHHQYLFDLWGDTVNTAARMESNGVPGGITLSEAAHQAVADTCRCEFLGETHIKGKGNLKRYLFRELSA